MKNIPGEPKPAAPLARNGAVIVQTYRVRPALFGDYNLVGHPADEDPGVVMLGYVLLEGEQTIHRSMRLKGDWRDHKNHPFTKPLVAWYSMEKLDGSPLV